MNASLVAFLATLAVACAAPSGLGLGLGLGVVSPGAIIVPPRAATVISGPVGLGLGLPVSPWGIAAPAPILAPAPLIAPVAPAGAVALTNGGGVVQASVLGAAVSGPKTAPVVIEGPSGVIKANGLWGPTLAGVLH